VKEKLSCLSKRGGIPRKKRKGDLDWKGIFVDDSSQKSEIDYINLLPTAGVPI